MPPFDIDQFMASAVVTQANSTEYAMAPLGDHPCECVKVEGRKIITKAGDERPLLEVFWRPKGFQGPPAKQAVWLDLNAQGDLDFTEGLNVDLGRLRVAVGQNDPAPWGPQRLIGTRATCRIVHEGRYANVSLVAPLHTTAPAQPLPAAAAAPAPTPPMIGMPPAATAAPATAPAPVQPVADEWAPAPAPASAPAATTDDW